MAEAPPHQATESATLKFARAVVRNRGAVALFLIVSTSFFFYPILNGALAIFDAKLPGPVVRIDTEARAQWPDHPFIHAQDKFAAKFGGSATVAIAVVVKEGTIFNPETIAKIHRITRRLDGIGYDSHTDERDDLRDQWEEEESLTPKQIQKELDRLYPPYPVNHYRIMSVTHNSTRVVQIESSGDIETTVLVDKLPKTQEEADQIGELVRQNPPFIYGRLVAHDQQGALITAGFITDRLNTRETYMAVFDFVQQIKADEEDENHTI